ncbi:MAG: hypothetical protein E7672_06495 [Ruminococcaceae bacterium]|nr:hypothetical protein [Oscillospiraceae bacterium]
MKREIEKKIKSISDGIGTAAAEEMRQELTEDLVEEFDKRVDAGMSELDAYRDVLKNVDEIKKLFESLPVTEEEEAAKERKKSSANLNKILSRISSCCWLLVVIVYFWFSFTYGMWHLTWLIFIWGSIGQTFLDMIKSYNRGKALKKVLKSGLSKILWQMAVIVFFVVSFAMSIWNTSWLIFIATAIVQIILNAVLDD